VIYLTRFSAGVNTGQAYKLDREFVRGFNASAGACSLLAQIWKCQPKIDHL